MGEGVSALMADYDRELSERLAAAASNISSAHVTSRPPADAAAALDSADSDLREASDVLTSMALEAAGQGSASRARLDARKAEAARVHADLRAARIALATARGERERADLLDHPSHGPDGNEIDLELGRDGMDGISDPRARLLDQTRKLHENSAERILESRRNIAQTESIGAGILQDLQNQRATILRARDNLGGVDDGLNQSSSIINTMNRRALINKIVLYAVGLMFALICLWMVGNKLIFAHKST
jgi:vesicle transport through interaction with t-SNAREs 1